MLGSAGCWGCSWSPSQAGASGATSLAQVGHSCTWILKTAVMRP